MDDAGENRTIARIVCSGTLFVCVIIYGAWPGIRPEPTYKFVDEITAADTGRDLKIHGWVQAGSIVHTGDQHWFTLVRSGKGVRVMVRGPVDRFRDQWELVVEGRLAAGGQVFAGTRVYSKCNSTYEVSILEGEPFR